MKELYSEQQIIPKHIKSYKQNYQWHSALKYHRNIINKTFGCFNFRKILKIHYRHRKIKKINYTMLDEKVIREILDTSN